MAVKESEKTYIECRMIILGEKNVGKKSFIGKLLSVSSTSMIRNYEAEKEFNKKLDELRKRVEREEELLIQSEQEKYRTYNTKSDSNILDNSLTKNKKQNNRSKSKESEEKKSIQDFCDGQLRVRYFDQIPEPQEIEKMAIMFSFTDDSIPKIENSQIATKTNDVTIEDVLNFWNTITQKNITKEDLSQLKELLGKVVDIDNEKRQQILDTAQKQYE